MDKMFDTALIFFGVFCIAFAFAPVGLGGGLLFVPLLHYGADLPIDGTLLAVSLSLTAVVSYGSGLAHRKKGHHDDEAIKSALVGAIPGALLGVGIVVVLGDNLDTVFKTVSIAILAWALVKTRRKINSSNSTDADENGEPREIQHKKLRLGAATGGTLSSVLAIGAGVIYVPVLQQYTGLSTRKSIGSSLHLMMVVVPIAVITHLAFISSSERDALVEQIGVLFALPFLTFIGARLGAQFGMNYISSQNIMKIFMTLTAVVLVRYLWDLGGLIV
tara:strand:+ start:23019 stop:23843 length:825 start_codon:yes stop_codon:yes gene_type:complete